MLTVMLRRLGAVRSREGREAGVGMILVIGIAIFVAALAATAVAISLNGLAQSRNRVSYEQALAVAETGVNFALGNIQEAYDTSATDYPIPAPTTVESSTICDLPVMADSLTRPASASAEQTWARQQIQDIITQDSGCVQHSPNGDYVIFHPSATMVDGAPKAGRVYVQSWVPSINASNAVTRLIKNEYVFMPYRPTLAVLTGGDLQIDSSTTVTSAYGVDPTTAGIHANGVISVSNGNPVVSGLVSSTGTSSASSNNFSANPGGAVTTSDPQRLPFIDAYALYQQAPAVLAQAQNSATADMNSWNDLCPDGTVRAYNGGTTPRTPCQGQVLNQDSTTGALLLPFRGWNYNSSQHTWIASANVPSGIYYAADANVDVGTGNGTIPNITVIAQAQYSQVLTPTDLQCSTKQYGSINWNHYALGAPAYPNLWFYADTDLNTGSNFTAGSNTSSSSVVSGMFVAGDQINLQTSSTGAVGSVVAADQCTSPPKGSSPVTEPQLPGEGIVSLNEVKNPAIYFDPNANAPFTSIVDTTLWLEYVG